MHHTTIDPTEIAKFNHLAHDWWDKNAALKTLHDINPCRYEFIAQHINVPTCTILDVGCGGGILTETLAHNQAQVCALDASDTLIQIAKFHAVQQGLKIEYTCAALEDYAHAPFDAIVCMELLEHVCDPEKIFKHCAQLLKNGGLLFVSTINRTIKSYLSAIIAAEYLLRILPRQTHDYAKFIRPNEAASMARKHGFNILDIRGIGYNPITRKAWLTPSVAVNYLMVCNINI